MTATALAAGRPAARPAAAPGRVRRVASWLLVALIAVTAWEGFKWVAGDPWRIDTTLAGAQIRYEHVPPLRLRLANDRAGSGFVDGRAATRRSVPAAG